MKTFKEIEKILETVNSSDLELTVKMENLKSEFSKLKPKLSNFNVKEDYPFYGVDCVGQIEIKYRGNYYVFSILLNNKKFFLGFA
jgi:hypothetical protein